MKNDLQALRQAAIAALDLGPIKVKLMDQEEGEGWSAEQVNMVEKWYKRFLLMNLKHPGGSIVPNKEIDTFWHYHILDTYKYAEDCQNVFGKFFHHFPYFGMRGEEDARALKDAFARTGDLFLAEFGESLGEFSSMFSSSDERVQHIVVVGSAKCKAGNCRSCKGSVCKSVADGIRPIFAG